MNMIKKSTFALFVLLGIGLSSSSPASSSKDYPQFLPKIQAESSSYKEVYRSARIYVEINSMSGDMDDLLEDLEDSAYKAAEILSQVLFVKPQAQPLKLGEKNLCKSIQLDTYMKLKELEADLAVFFSLSDNFIQNSTSAKVCEFSSDNQLKSIEIKVDRKIYQELNADKKVSLLNKAIISIIFNGKSENYAKELEESLENLKYQPISTACKSPCKTCSSTSFTSCFSCHTGYYLSDSNCLACDPQCASCIGTYCTTCTDPTHMSDPPLCVCPYNSVLTNGNCVCNTGYYYSNNYHCAACASNCATCEDDSTDCLTCVDPVHMSSKPYCNCPNNSKLTQGTCTCNSGYYYSANTKCSACNKNCVTCAVSADNCLTCPDPTHMSAPACSCPTNSKLTESSCVCPSGYYWASNTVCTACNPQCATCSGSSSNCSSCTDKNHSSGTPYCNCPKHSTLISGSCVCDIGYYFSQLTVCTACQTNCATCSSTNPCLTCIDPIHMTAAPKCSCPSSSSLQGNSCVCNTGYYFAIPSTCFPCQTNCGSCSGSASSCLTCIDTVHMSSPPNCSCPSSSTLTGVQCVCNAGYYYTSNTVCSACPSNCATCSTGTVCLTCIDTIHMTAAPTCSCPSNSVLNNNVCTCINGYFYQTTTICAACNSNCATCSNTASNCITCTDTTHMTAAPTCACPANSVVNVNGQCACNTGYYFSANGYCSPCSPQCSACTVSDSTCSVCIDTVHMGNPPTCACPANSALVAGTCTCNIGLYFSSNSVCSTCASQCGSCSITSTNCGSCIDTVHMSAAPTCACPANASLFGNSCACNLGYYFSSNTVCSACQPNCASCGSSSSNCNTCQDTTHMSAAPACLCPNNSVLIGSSCVCNTGYFYSSNTVCSACQINCQACTVSASNCVICSDTVHMTAAPACACPALSSLNNGSCVCNAGYYFSSTTVCSPCNNNCAGCTNSAANCNACIDTTHMSAPPTCACPENAYLNGNTCQCNPGYYYSNPNTCSPTFQCPPQCAKCSSNNFCSSCNDPDNMYLNPENGTCRCWDQYATFNQTSGTCQCIQGYYLSSLGVCQICIPPCAQCSLSATFCTVCDDFSNMNLNMATGSCTCKDSESQFNPWAKACIPNSACSCNSYEINTYDYINVTNVINSYSKILR